MGRKWIVWLVMFLVAVFLIGLWPRTGGVPWDSASGDKKGAPGLDTFDSRVEQIADAMSAEEMVGQLLIIGIPGTQMEADVAEMINLRQIGGVTLFSRNIDNPRQVAQLNHNLQRVAAANKNMPLFIAIDQEGGEVDRFQDKITGFPAPWQLGALASPDAVRTSARVVATELRAMGINVNFAPVVDVAWDKSIMLKRSFGDDANLVATLAAAAVTGHREGGVISCAKHFPGLGRAVDDPHDGPVEIKVDLASLIKSDLVPYQRMGQDHLEIIMVGHALYPALDQQNPASVSPVVLQTLLRETLGFNGLIITDDLEMGALLVRDTVGNLAVQAVKAGVDLVLVCHTKEKQIEAYESLVAAVHNGEIDREQLKTSLKRIIALKLKWELDKNNEVTLDKVSGIIKGKSHQLDAQGVWQQLE